MIDVAAELDRFGALVGLGPGDLVESPAQSTGQPWRRYLGPGVVLEIATSTEGRRRLRLETVARQWAAEGGVPTPAVLAAEVDGGWLLSQWVEPVAVGGTPYVDGAVEAARMVAALPSPPAELAEASSWSAPRRTLLTRGVRVLLGGVAPRLWAAARRQLMALDHPLEVAHGDFYPRNVLGTGDGVVVVDWEYAGAAPRHTDLARMWSVLREADDRDHLLGVLLDGADADERHRVGALLLWHSLRLLGENLSAPHSERNQADLAHARRMLPEAGSLARELGSWPL